jgi:hypothetical protein
MSLINDALKRAKQAQQKNAPPPPSAAPLRPVEAPLRRSPPPRSLLVPIVVAVVLMFVGAVVLVLALKGGGKTDSGNNTLTQASAVTPTPSAPVDRATNVSVAVQPTPPIITNAPSVVVPTVITQTVVIIEKAEPVTNAVPPALPKLQGILYNPARPTAFLSGKSYVIGGRVGEFTVVGITKQSVTVERAGQTNVLTMEE